MSTIAAELLRASDDRKGGRKRWQIGDDISTTTRAGPSTTSRGDRIGRGT